MKNILVNIALANAIFEEKKNYIDTYYPFLLKTFQLNEISNLEQLSKNLKDLLGLDLPIHSIKDILHRKNESIFQVKKITKADWRITLNSDGKTELNDLLKREEEIDIEHSEFYTKFRDFSNRNEPSPYNLDDIKGLVESFIKQNIIHLSTKNEAQIKNGELNGFEKEFILFLAHIKSSDSKMTTVFEHLWKGTIIWNELMKDDQERVSLQLDKTLFVYVDTNFVFSLLGFHNPIVNQAAEELHQLMQEDENITLYILDKTLKEIVDLLDLYPSFKDDFYETEVDSIFYYLKEQGFTHAKLEKLKDELIDNLRNNLKIKFIEEPVLTEQKQKWLGTIYTYLHDIRTEINDKRKSKKSESAIEKNSHHDASVITHVLGVKDRYATRMENAKSVFLTSGFWLFRNYKNIHNQFEGYPSVILDGTFTNILYLKNPKPNSSIAIDQVIKSHSNYLIIDNNIWTQYLNEAKSLLKNSSIEIEDYSRLVSKNQYSQHLLLSSDPDEISSAQVMEVLESIKKDETEKEKKITSQNENIQSQDQKIISLEERLEALETQKLSDKANQDLKDALTKFDSDAKASALESWSIYKKSKRRLRIRYLVFILFSFMLITMAIILKSIFTPDNPETEKNLNLLWWCTIIIGILLFFIPFIRSFFKHDQVIISFQMMMSKRRENIRNQFIQTEIKEFKNNYETPNLSDFTEL